MDHRRLAENSVVQAPLRRRDYHGGGIGLIEARLQRRPGRQQARRNGRQIQARGDRFVGATFVRGTETSDERCAQAPWSNPSAVQERNTAKAATLAFAGACRFRPEVQRNVHRLLRSVSG
jgi:hypothetical protein